MLGLCGAHRVGKTALARAYAEAAKVPFVQTSASAVYKRLGYDPSKTYDFSVRLSIQEEILKDMDAEFAKYAGVMAVADRTPLDMIGYTLAEAIGDRVKEEDQERLARYVDNCFAATNKRFGVIVLVQPGIELVAEEGKAALNKAYIEHLNYLMLGLHNDARLTSRHYMIPKQTLELEKRVKSLQACVETAKTLTLYERMEMGQQQAATVH